MYIIELDIISNLDLNFKTKTI